MATLAKLNEFNHAGIRLTAEFLLSPAYPAQLAAALRLSVESHRKHSR